MSVVYLHLPRQDVSFRSLYHLDTRTTVLPRASKPVLRLLFHDSRTHRGITLTVLSSPAPDASFTRCIPRCCLISHERQLGVQRICHVLVSWITNKDVTTDLQVWNSTRDRSNLRQPVLMTRHLTSAGQRPDSYIFDGTPYNHPSNLRHGGSKTERENDTKSIRCCCKQLELRIEVYWCARHRRSVAGCGG
jgi:hypothetical protein